MEAIYIPRLLKAPQQTQAIAVDEFILGIDTLTPVRGTLKVQHCGNYLQVSVVAETILTLTCDRCLQQYNHRLSLETSELLWLSGYGESAKGLILDSEMIQEDLLESLPIDGYFDPYKWLYEQLSLALPLRQLCGKECQPPTILNTENTLPDQRWSALAALKNQLN